MRDIFEDIFINQPLDPVEAVRRNMRALKRRFYATAGVAETKEGFVLELDGRPARTPARHRLTLPSRPLGEAVAAEWESQTEVIDPARMPLTRLANTIVDGVDKEADAVTAEIAKYLASDLLFYRAEGPERLVARQARHWDPLLAWARDRGARFVLTEGVMFVRQPEEALARMRAVIPQDAWRLGAAHSVTTLTGSALIALALEQGAIMLDAAWAAANVDEDWNLDLWGRDELALARRAFRFAEMQAAATMLALTAI
jgi:chaperone required for assembly of F1-ATPase